MVLPDRPEPVRRARRRRYILPGHWQHISSRTQQGRFAFEGLPTDAKKRVWAIIGMANRRYGVQLAAFVLMSNHFHAMVSARRGSRVSKWVQYVKSNLARLTHELHGTAGTVWESPYRQTNLLTDEAELACLRYVLSHGVKEGLVAHPAAWPGPNCVMALVAGEAIVGEWFDREAWRAARRLNPAVGRAAFMHAVPAELTPLSVGKRSPETWRKVCRDMVDSIVAEHLTRDLPTVYRRVRDFSYVPEVTKKSRCHCFDARTLEGVDRVLTKEAEAARRSAVEASVWAMENLARRGLQVDAPHGTQWPAMIAEVIGEPWAEAEFPFRRGPGVQQAAG